MPCAGLVVLLPQRLAAHHARRTTPGAHSGLLQRSIHPWAAAPWRRDEGADGCLTSPGGRLRWRSVLARSLFWTLLLTAQCGGDLAIPLDAFTTLYLACSFPPLTARQQTFFVAAVPVWAAHSGYACLYHACNVSPGCGSALCCYHSHASISYRRVVRGSLSLTGCLFSFAFTLLGGSPAIALPRAGEPERCSSPALRCRPGAP